MRLYHGTDTYFEEIQIAGHSSPLRDFGAGFYLTTFFNQARIQAQRKAKRKKPSYVYKYEVRNFNRSDYNVLELLHYDKDWLDFLKYNRLYGGKQQGSPLEWQNLDIIYDRMADNKWNVITDDLMCYARNEIIIDEIISHLSKNVEWDQYCFKTERALRLLVKIDLEDVSE